MNSDGIKVEGFFRLMIKEGDVVVGDTGYQKNQVVNQGFESFICSTIGAIAGSSQIGYMGIGTGTDPDATADTLPDEVGSRMATTNSVVSSKTLRCTTEWASTDHPGGTPSLTNVGLYSAGSGANLACGKSYTGSTWNSNQAVYATYELRFA